MSDSGKWNDLGTGGSGFINQRARRDMRDRTRRSEQTSQSRSLSSSENTSPVLLSEAIGQGGAFRRVAQGGAAAYSQDGGRRRTDQSRRDQTPELNLNDPDANGNFMFHDGNNSSDTERPRSDRRGEGQKEKTSSDQSHFDKALMSVLGELDRDESSRKPAKIQGESSAVFENNFDDPEPPGAFNIPARVTAGERPRSNGWSSRPQEFKRNQGNQTSSHEHNAGNDADDEDDDPMEEQSQKQQAQDPVQKMLGLLMNGGQNQDDRGDPFTALVGDRPDENDGSDGAFRHLFGGGMGGRDPMEALLGRGHPHRERNDNEDPFSAMLGRRGRNPFGGMMGDRDRADEQKRRQNEGNDFFSSVLPDGQRTGGRGAMLGVGQNLHKAGDARENGNEHGNRNRAGNNDGPQDAADRNLQKQDPVAALLQNMTKDMKGNGDPLAAFGISGAGDDVGQSGGKNDKNPLADLLARGNRGVSPNDMGHGMGDGTTSANGGPSGLGFDAGLVGIGGQGIGGGRGLEAMFGGGGSRQNPLPAFMRGRGSDGGEGGKPNAGIPGGLDGNPFQAMMSRGRGGMGMGMSGSGVSDLASRLGGGGIDGDTPVGSALSALIGGGQRDSSSKSELYREMMEQAGFAEEDNRRMGGSQESDLSQPSQEDVLRQMLGQPGFGQGGGREGDINQPYQEDVLRQMMGQPGFGQGGGGGRTDGAQDETLRQMMRQSLAGEGDINPNAVSDNDVIQQLLGYEAMRAQNNRSPRAEQALHTIIIVDTSGSMDGEPLMQAGRFISRFINGLEELQFEYNLQENVALVCVGGEIQVVQHFTNDFSLIRRATDSLSASGSSRLHMGLLVPTSLLSHGSHDTRGMGGIYRLENHMACPRVIFITDGYPSPTDDVPGYLPRPDDQNVFTLQNLCLELIQNVTERTLCKIYCVPVGNTNMNFLEMLSQSTGGRVVQPADAKRMSRCLLHHVLVSKLHESGIQRPTRAAVAEILKQITATADDDDINGVFEVIDEGEPDIEARDQRVAQEMMQTMQAGRGRGGNKGERPGQNPQFMGQRQLPGAFPGLGGMGRGGGGGMPMLGGRGHPGSMPQLGGNEGLHSSGEIRPMPGMSVGGHAGGNNAGGGFGGLGGMLGMGRGGGIGRGGAGGIGGMLGMGGGGGIGRGGAGGIGGLFGMGTGDGIGGEGGVGGIGGLLGMGRGGGIGGEGGGGMTKDGLEVFKEIMEQRGEYNVDEPAGNGYGSVNDEGEVGGISKDRIEELLKSGRKCNPFKRVEIACNQRKPGVTDNTGRQKTRENVRPGITQPAHANIREEKTEQPNIGSKEFEKRGKNVKDRHRTEGNFVRDRQSIMLGMGDGTVQNDKASRTLGVEETRDMKQVPSGRSRNAKMETEYEENPIILGMGGGDNLYNYDGLSHSPKGGTGVGKNEKRGCRPDQDPERDLGVMLGFGSEGNPSGNRYNDDRANSSPRYSESRDTRFNIGAHERPTSKQTKFKQRHTGKDSSDSNEKEEPFLGLIHDNTSDEEIDDRRNGVFGNVPPMSFGLDAYGKPQALDLMNGVEENYKGEDEVMDKLASLLGNDRPRGGGMLGNDALDEAQGDGGGLLRGFPDMLSLGQRRDIPRGPPSHFDRSQPNMQTFMQNFSRETRTQSVDSRRDKDEDVMMGLGSQGETEGPPWSRQSAPYGHLPLLGGNRGQFDAPLPQGFAQPQDGAQSQLQQLEQLLQNSQDGNQGILSLDELMRQPRTRRRDDDDEYRGMLGGV